MALYVIVVMLIVIMIIGFMCCEHDSKRVIKNNNERTERIKEEDKITIEIESDKESDANRAVKPVSLGNFRLTAYCSCSLCCGEWANNRPLDENGNKIVYGSIGERLKEGYSVAVDPTIIPYQSKVIINDNVYEAQDCGGAIKENRIDVYFENHDDALEFGVQYAEVFTISE